jgi:hypothetical protein
VQNIQTPSQHGKSSITYRNQGKWNEAEQLEVQVMDMRKKLLGAEHPDTLTAWEI